MMYRRWVVLSGLLPLFSPAWAAAGGFPAASECALLGTGEVAAEYRQLAAVPVAEAERLADRPFVVAVHDAAEDRREVEVRANGKRRLLYRMDRNHVTEGWNWHPEADPAREDYYRYKFLPLGEQETETASPRFEVEPATGGFEVRFVRRDAFYFAFDNPYDFYARDEEDGGFTVETAIPVERFVLIARGRHAAPYRAESTTYWRAQPSRRVDLTLKNRYFMGRLETLWFCSEDGSILGRLGK